MIPKNRSHPRPGQKIILVAAVLTSPLLCFWAALIPVGKLLPALDVFAAEVQVHNQTATNLTITPVTTTTGQPQIIWQDGLIPRCALSLDPGETLVLQYDAADAYLTGLVVCSAPDTCGQIAFHGADLTISSLADIDPLPEDWYTAYQQTPRRNPTPLIMALLGSLPFTFYLIWLWLFWRGRPNTN